MKKKEKKKVEERVLAERRTTSHTAANFERGEARRAYACGKAGFRRATGAQQPIGRSTDRRRYAIALLSIAVDACWTSAKSAFHSKIGLPFVTRPRSGATASATAAQPTTAPLAIVMPVLDEAAALEPALRALAALRARGVRVIVVDGASRDRSFSIAQAHADLALAAPRGRASQMNAGAAAAGPVDLLLFLHADSALPPDADLLVRAALAGPRVWGRFDVRIDSKRRLLRAVARAMNLRSRITGIATGDQAMFMTRAAFDAVGGFPALPLMEDIALSRRLKRVSRPVCLKPPVLTSARRWERNGVWRTILLMWRLRAAWFLGADAAALARRYDRGPVEP